MPQDLSPPAPPQAAPAATHASLSSPPQPVTSEPLAGPWGRAPDPTPAVCGFCRRRVCWVQVSHRSVSFGTRGLVSRTALATRPAGRCGKHWSEGADVLALGNWFQKRNPQGGAAPGGQRSVMSLPSRSQRWLLGPRSLCECWSRAGAERGCLRPEAGLFRATQEPWRWPCPASPLEGRARSPSLFLGCTASGSRTPGGLLRRW